VAHTVVTASLRLPEPPCVDPTLRPSVALGGGAGCVAHVLLGTGTVVDVARPAPQRPKGKGDREVSVRAAQATRTPHRLSLSLAHPSLQRPLPGPFEGLRPPAPVTSDPSRPPPPQGARLSLGGADPAERIPPGAPHRRSWVWDASCHSARAPASVAPGEAVAAGLNNSRPTEGPRQQHAVATAQPKGPQHPSPNGCPRNLATARSLRSLADDDRARAPPSARRHPFGPIVALTFVMNPAEPVYSAPQRSAGQLLWQIVRKAPGDYRYERARECQRRRHPSLPRA